MVSKKKQQRKLKQHLKKQQRLKVLEIKNECLKELLIKHKPNGDEVGWWWVLGY